ncbi:MAG: iron-containing alcohol dehydrogenase [Planctomycetaceae bacterium]|jgi:alcohol dehydrogenase YqhD (iron-dependent ADH family)|nr:iron-containing alcohol dehydrogenase [Planctomycetaceae bacterium]
MQNFTFHNPTKIIFGKNTIGQLGGEAKPYGKKAILVYGQGAIKKNGVYEQAVASLKSAGIEFVEYSGVRANPVLSHTREGIRLAKSEKADFIAAVGGGSVIDEAKAICAGACESHDVWDFYTGQATPERALPLVAVLTVAATGTEMNGGTVITNEETKEKFGWGNPILAPKVSILDPTTTFSIGAAYTAYAAVDSVTHLLEGYFTSNDPNTILQDRYVEGVVRSIIDVTETMIQKPDDYEARATFMWAATLAWNSISPCGIGAWSTPNHLIGHSMSALFDTPHGASLSIALSGWLPWYTEQGAAQVRQLAQLGKAVFDITESSPNHAAESTIEALRNWFRRIKSPTKLADINVDASGMEAIAENVEMSTPHWRLPDYNKARVINILKRCR